MAVVIEFVLVGGLTACIAAAAILAIAEVSLLRVRPALVATSSGVDGRSQRLLDLLDDLPIVLNVVLLLVLFAQVGAATISAVLAARWFGPPGVPVASVAMTAFLFMYAEALPKTRAVRDPYRNAVRVAPLLNILVVLFRRPVSALLRFVDFHAPGEERNDVATEAELRLLARQAAAVGEIEPDDFTLLERSFRFGDLQIGEVMVPRSDIRYVKADESVEVGFRRALNYGHRRLPVVGSAGLDDVVGVVRLRDLAAASGTSRHSAASLMSAPLFCSPTDSVATALRSMQVSEQWLAIVVVAGQRDDVQIAETVGLVTVEDLVAELVGEIADDRNLSARSVLPPPNR